jgi:hypothetical protein
MKMKTKILSLVICTVAAITITSCEEDFLDKQPLSQISPESYLWTAEELGNYAVTLYSYLTTHNSVAGGASIGTFGADIHTDDMAAIPGLGNEQGFSLSYAPGHYKTSQTGGPWEFNGIYKINYFLQTVLPRLRDDKITGNKTDISQYIGEVYFLRAVVYFNKLQALGDFPIIRSNLPLDEKVLIEASKRAPRNEVARFILSDLDSAAMLMQNGPLYSGNRISKECAILLKSRVALFEATWLKYFKGTAFVPKGPDWPGATKDYNQSYNFPSGSIDGEISYFLDQALESSKIVADAATLVPNTGLIQQTTSDPVNPYFNLFNDVDMSGYSEVLLWRAYNSAQKIANNIEFVLNTNNAGIGLTRGLVDSYLMSNGLPIYDPASGYQGDDSIGSTVINRDDRLHQFLKIPGQKKILFNLDKNPNVLIDEEYPTFSGSYLYATGYTGRKGVNYDALQVVYNNCTVGSIVFRSVEALLNYMEADYEKNGSLDASSQSYWAAIRTRAGVDPDFNKTIAATDMSKEALNDWGAYSAGQLIDATLYNIRRERRSELMTEGLRNMDLHRWRAKDQMITEGYHIEGFKLWGPMRNKYPLEVLEGDNVSPESRSMYLRPYEKSPTSFVYDGYRWNMAHYLVPISIVNFQNTAQSDDLSTSPIYQNPGWPTRPDEAPEGAK